jgi:hypothetical protein
MMHVCRFLRWKGYKSDQSDEARASAFGRNQVQYTCLHTGQPWGPTDEPAAPEHCQDGRSCFERREAVRCPA